MAPRGRVQMRPIEDRVSRQVRFSKRRSGLFKKARELTVLCDAEVALLVFSPAGKSYKYSSARIEDTYDRYHQCVRNMDEADQNRNHSQDHVSSDLKSSLTDITTWSLQNNAEESDGDDLEKLEGLLITALRDTRSKKAQKLSKQASRGSTSACQNCNGASKQEQGKK